MANFKSQADYDRQRKVQRRIRAQYLKGDITAHEAERELHFACGFSETRANVVRSFWDIDK